MYLKSLELTGFKSFAKKTVLEFNAPITAIVGPNGSGKSNIAEAFRFVLGEQSIKSMRGKRTEDLIWNGSPELGRLSRAAVKLFFDNRPTSSHVSPSSSEGGSTFGGKEGERLLNIDFDEVILERVIYRDVSSEYILNGSQVRLRDIVEVLAGAHIGASGHHIISQGEADRILNASLRERREMIEDALGLKLYQWKREESERKLLKTEENMKKVEGLRREIAPRLSFLKRQVEKIEKARAMKDELRVLYREYLAAEHRFIRTQKEKIAKEEREPHKELSELERKIAAARHALEQARGQDAKAQAVIAIEKKLTLLRGEREDVSRALGRLEGEIAAGERLAREQTGVGESGTIPLSEIEALVRASEESAGEDLTALRRALEKIKQALRELLLKYRTRSSFAEKAEDVRATLREKKNAAEKKLSAIQRTEAEAGQEEKQLRMEIERAKDSNRDAEKEMFRIMARQNELRGFITALRVRQQEVEHREEDFKRELTEGALLAGREILEYEEGDTLNPPEVDRVRQEERRRTIEKLKIRIEEAGGGSGAEVLKEFTEASERDQFLVRELADIEKSAETLRELIAELEQKLDEEFRGGIEKINKEFQNYFSLMFGGGTARLTTTKPEKKVRREVDELLASEEGVPVPEDEEGETGIDMEVNLPRKKIKGLMMLSGGERALTSIALLFAMSQVKPPPFLVLDETDAALDEANSRRYGDMVENLSRHSQLILITHNRETMSRAGVIYGVTMNKSGVSKLLSIAFDEAVAVAK